MVADQPLDVATLATAVGHPVDDVAAALAELAEEYTAQGRGFELRNVAGGWRFYTREEYAAVVEGFVLEGQQARLTQAALETLAVVAYKQPVSRARVSAIRGVNVDGVMRTLLTRGLVEEAGQDESSGAHLYRTTAYFLERIGVTSLDELPELAPYLPDMDDMEDELAQMAGRSDGRTRSRTGSTDAVERTPTEPRRTVTTTDRAGRPGPAPEVPRPVRRRLPPQVRGADARRAGRGRRRGRHPARHQDRPAHRRGPGRRQAAAADLAERLPGAQQAARRGLDDVRPGGPPDAPGPGRRPARAALPRRPARHRHVRADPAHQRRRLRAADGAPVVRGGQDVRRRGRGRGHQGHPQAAARGRGARRRAGDRARRRGSSATARARPSSSWSSTRAATGSCAGCSTTSATPYAASPAPRSARSSSAGSAAASCAT